MKKHILGIVKERKTKKNNVINYNVNLFNGQIKSTFRTFVEAHNFWKEHMLGILETNETNSISLEYSTKDKRKKYFVYEKEYCESKVKNIEMEMSKYDYYESHKEYYGKFINKNSINERYYSFHDIARHKTLLPKTIYSIMTIFNFINIFFTLIFFLFGIDIINISSKIHNIFDESEILLNTLIITLVVFSLILSILALISCWKPFIRYKRKKDELIEMNWKEEWKGRKTIKFLSIFVGIISIICFIWYLIFFINNDLFSKKYLKYPSIRFNMYSYFVMFVSIFMTIIFSISNSTSIFIWNKKIFKKYYSKKEMKLFSKWISGKTNDPIYKKSVAFFRLPFDENEKLVLKKFRSKSQLYLKADKEDLNRFRIKQITHNNIAVKKYLESKGL